MISLNTILQGIRKQTEAMLHWQTKAGQDINEGPYPTMLGLIEALERMQEQRNMFIKNELSARYPAENIAGTLKNIICDCDEAIAEILSKEPTR